MAGIENFVAGPEDAGAFARAGEDHGLAVSLVDIQAFLGERKGIALVGRVDTSPNWMSTYRSFGENVKIAFVNPKGGGDGTYPVFRAIADLPEEFDTVVIRLSAERAAAAVRECGEKGFRTVVIFSNGFAETGAEGARLQAALAQAGVEAGVRIIGPNTPTGLLEQLPLPPDPRGGLIGLVTQSGANGRLLVQGVSMGACFGRWISTGNEVDLEAADFLNYFVSEDSIAVIAMYIEGFKSIRRLRAALENANSRQKPVIILKIGATERGARAATSHTGHLSGADSAISGLFEQYGVVRVQDVDALLETSSLFAKLPRDSAGRCAFYSYSGGAAAIMGELGEAHGIEIPELAQKTRSRLEGLLSANFGIRNPVDNGGVLMHQSEETRLEVLDAIAGDPAIDIVVIGFGTGAGYLSELMARDILAWAADAPKPVVAVWPAASQDAPAYRDLVSSGVPIFRSFTRCAEALRDYATYQARKASFRHRAHGRLGLTEVQSRGLAADGVLANAAAAALVRDAGVRLAREHIAGSAAEAEEAARTFGETVVLKIASPDFPHRTEVGLVKVGVPLCDVATASQELLDRAILLKAGARIDGVQVQELVCGGVEMILGLSRDRQCGPCLTVGFGGIYAELLRDVATRPLPVDEQDIVEMISTLRLAPLLDGWRGAPVLDKQSLVTMARHVADLGLAAERLIELDLNPVIIGANGAVAVDVLAVAGGT